MRTRQLRVCALVALGVCLLPASSRGQVQKSPATTSPTQDFNHIYLLGTGKLTIRQARTCAVSYQAPKGLQAAVLIQVKNGTLYILGGGGVPAMPNLPALPGGVPNVPGFPGGVPALPNVPGFAGGVGGGAFPGVAGLGGPPVEYTIDIKDLKSITMAGTGNAEVNNIVSKQLTISVTGTGSLTAYGTADYLQLSITGTGGFEGKYLQTGKTQVNHAGFGKALVNARESLDATIIGTGSVEYLGKPKVQQSILGSGKVVPVGEP
jgi:hypothetical protein